MDVSDSDALVDRLSDVDSDNVVDELREADSDSLDVDVCDDEAVSLSD